jgi:hypothetical protein
MLIRWRRENSSTFRPLYCCEKSPPTVGQETVRAPVLLEKSKIFAPAGN